MNIVSTLVGLSVMGAAAPSIMDMSIQPFIAQKRAVNFAKAEAVVVTHAANAEATQSAPDIPDGCSVPAPVDSVYSISCSRGEGTYRMSATRSYRILPEIADGGSGGRKFEFETPDKFSGHQCPVYDTWGVYGYNQQWSNQPACKPAVIWNQSTYLASTPDDWLFDINNHNGWGNHPDY